MLLFGKKSGDKSEGGAIDRFKSILDNLQDAVIVYDKDFNVSVFNASAARIFNMDAREVIGSRLSPEKVSNTKYTFLIQTLFPSLAPVVQKKTEPGIYPQIVDISFPDANLELRTSTNLIFAGDEDSGFVKVITDRTKEIEAHKAKSEFIHMTAHKIRTPLTMASWALDILRKNESLSEDDKAIASQGYQASQKLSQIVTDLLDVERLEEGKFSYNFKDIDIISFIDQALKNAETYIKNNNLNLSVYFDRGGNDSIILNADPDSLGKALTNIIDNAIKYNIKNGSITVSVSKVPEKNQVQISTKDTGIGIPEGNTSEVSEKFFRADNAKKVEAEGSGLGLFIAKAIISRHGGSLWVESILGRGTTVNFTLPLDKISIKGEFGGEVHN